jgi:AAA15 family ATPase/GTPase
MLKIDHLTFYQNDQFKVEKCSNINLIVGANNTGKTTLLQDIQNSMRQLVVNPLGNRWVFGIKMSVDHAEAEIKRIFPELFKHDEFCNLEEIDQNIFTIKRKGEVINWNDATFEKLKAATTSRIEWEVKHGTINQDSRTRNFFHFLVQVLVKLEDARERISTPFHTTIVNIEEAKENDFVLHLYKNRTLFKTIQRELKIVYGLEVDFDNIPQGIKPIRIIKGKINRGITDHRRLNLEWNNKTSLLDDVGHGIRSYLTLAFSLLNTSNQVILIDEPEMFIHPPQRRALGRMIAKLAKDLNKQLFIATHDAEFIRGVLSASLDRIKIFRLFQEGDNRFHSTISGSEINRILNKKTPNIISERILNSLLYQKTILCEGESDRLIYEEATAEYLHQKYQDVNFIGLNGHSTVVALFDKLRAIGINAAMILDIDYLRTGNFASSINDAALKNDFGSLSSELKTVFPKNGPGVEKFKKAGIRFLKSKHPTLAVKVEGIMKRLEACQVFIVPVGELESWIRAGKNDLDSLLIQIRKRKIAALDKFLRVVLNT